MSFFSSSPYQLSYDVFTMCVYNNLWEQRAKCITSAYCVQLSLAVPPYFVLKLDAVTDVTRPTEDDWGKKKLRRRFVKTGYIGYKKGPLLSLVPTNAAHLNASHCANAHAVIKLTFFNEIGDRNSIDLRRFYSQPIRCLKKQLLVVSTWFVCIVMRVDDISSKDQIRLDIELCMSLQRKASIETVYKIKRRGWSWQNSWVL